ncbi:Uu.00g028820.m01.CDS01 [Anthostomella pinea]|uniref:Lysophospholipase n=1 Tax=Anthostomella pinea TaxID=933095 RepID=A0AAI8V7Z3_9PEZI|nr:Uu.00g028820.m01.CDS01 [Anthostomella pinea]
MRISSVSLPLSLLTLISSALAAPSNGDRDLHAVVLDVLARAAPESPSGDYAPANVDCPSERPTIRSAAKLSQSETDWLKLRRPKTIDPMIAFLKSANIANFDAVGFVNSNSKNFSVVPNIGIAISGGGYRALMNGAGFVAAADNRVAGSTDAGGIGSLLQASTYLAGLSGGGWLVGSIFANNFSSITTLRDGYDGSSLWQFSNSIFEGPKSSGISLLNSADYWKDVVDQIDDKEDAGYPASITDPWGRTLSYQLINAQDGGPAYTFSSIADDSNFTAADTPMPILVADERSPGTTIVSANSTVHEINPWEMGSFDPTVFGFAPTRYVGSNFSGGSIPSDGHCVRGFDQYGFVMGTSSSLFNEFLQTNLSSYDVPSIFTDLLTKVLVDVDEDDNDIAVWEPNPFYGYNNATNKNAGATQLTLVDGGLDLQNIPLHPLIQPERAVDVIFAVDSSADTTYNWPNGTALRATYARTKEPISNGTAFPAVPDAETFINLGLNKRPTFFGCNTSEFSSYKVIPPLIVYMPNAPYTQDSNVSTFTPSYADDLRDSIITNGFNVATMGNGTVDKDWPACAACAVLSRSLERTGTDVPAACQTCFTRYCWNGTTDSTPVGSYEPTAIIGLDALGAGARLSVGGQVGVAWAVVGLVGLVLVI